MHLLLIRFFVNLVGKKSPPWSIYKILEKLNCPLKIKKTKGDTLGLLDDSVGSLDGTI